MKTVQELIDGLKVKISSTEQTQKNAYKALDDLKQNWKDTLPDLPFSEEVAKKLNTYLADNSATELWATDKYKALDKGDFLKAKKADYLPLPTDNLTPEIIEKYRLVMEEGVFKRDKKLADNYSIAIGKLKEKLLLLRLIQRAVGTPAEDTEGFKEYLDAALSEKKSTPTGWVPEIGMDYLAVVQHFKDEGKDTVKATELAGKALARAGLTIGVGYKVVKG